MVSASQTNEKDEYFLAVLAKLLEDEGPGTVEYWTGSLERLHVLATEALEQRSLVRDLRGRIVDLECDVEQRRKSLEQANTSKANIRKERDTFRAILEKTAMAWSNATLNAWHGVYETLPDCVKELVEELGRLRGEAEERESALKRAEKSAEGDLLSIVWDATKRLPAKLNHDDYVHLHYLGAEALSSREKIRELRKALEAENGLTHSAKKKNHKLANRANRAENQVKKLSEQVKSFHSTIKAFEARPKRVRLEDEQAQDILDRILKAEASGDRALVQFHLARNAHLMITLALERLASPPYSLAYSRAQARMNRRALRAEAQNSRLNGEVSTLQSEVSRLENELRRLIDGGCPAAIGGVDCSFCVPPQCPKCWKFEAERLEQECARLKAKTEEQKRDAALGRVFREDLEAEGRHTHIPGKGFHFACGAHIFSVKNDLIVGVADAVTCEGCRKALSEREVVKP